MVPIDKAANNVAFICKRFYAQILLKELGLSHNEPSSTYSLISELSHQNIISHHKLSTQKQIQNSCRRRYAHITRHLLVTQIT